MLKRLTISIACMMISGCGAYFVSTGNLKTQHQEDLIPTGLWGADDMYLAFFDGPDHTDRVCMVENDFTAWADVYFVAASDKDALLIFSDPSFGAGKTASGNVLYGMQKNDQSISLVNLFGQISEGDKLPFASACTDENTETSLQTADYIPYCLSDAATAQDIMNWALEQDDLDTAILERRPDSELPSFCRKNKPPHGKTGGG